MDISPLLNALSQASFHLIAFSLALSRLGGVILVTPAFTRIGLTGIIKGGVGLALAIPLAPMIGGAVAGQEFTPEWFASLVFKEMFVGILIGLVMGVPFWAAETAGDILDLQRGTSMATLIDPSSDQSGVLGAFLVMALLALFYASGGLVLLVGVIYDSYQIWPVGRFLPLLSPEAGLLLLGLLDKVFTMGLMLVAPLVLALFLSDVALALLARAAPQMQVFDLSLSVKSLVLVLLIVLYSSFMFDYMGKDLATLLEGRRQLEIMRGPSP